MFEKWFKKPDPLKKYEILLQFVDEPFDISMLPKAEREEIYQKCREYVDDGILVKIGQYLASKVEADICYNLKNEPVMVTQAELHRHILTGMNKIVSEVEKLAKQVTTKKVVFDKYSLTE